MCRRPFPAPAVASAVAPAAGPGDPDARLAERCRLHDAVADASERAGDHQLGEVACEREPHQAGGAEHEPAEQEPLPAGPVEERAGAELGEEGGEEAGAGHQPEGVGGEVVDALQVGEQREQHADAGRLQSDGGGEQREAQVPTWGGRSGRAGRAGHRDLRCRHLLCQQSTARSRPRSPRPCGWVSPSWQRC